MDLLALRRIKQLPTSWFVVGSSLAIGAPWVAGVWIGGWAGIAVFAVAVVATLVTGWLVRERIRWRELPLEVGSACIVGQLDGAPAYRFRVCLGEGRTVSSVEEKIWFQPHNADPIALPIVSHRGARVGPWTVVALDHERKVSEGDFVVEVDAHESGRSWKASVRVPKTEARPGRFAALDGPDWARVES